MNLTLDREHLRQLLIRDDFYAACPAFGHLEAVAKETVALLAGKPSCCGGAWPAYRGLLDAFFLVLKVSDAETVAGLKRYLGSKKGYLPTTVTVYYRRGRKGPIGKLVL